MSKVRYAVQSLETGKKRSHARWVTIAVLSNRSAAEHALRSVRMDRIKVAQLTRIKAFNGDQSRCYSLMV